MLKQMRENNCDKFLFLSKISIFGEHFYFGQKFLLLRKKLFTKISIFENSLYFRQKIILTFFLFVNQKFLFLTKIFFSQKNIFLTKIAICAKCLHFWQNLWQNFLFLKHIFSFLTNLLIMKFSKKKYFNLTKISENIDLESSAFLHVR